MVRKLRWGILGPGIIAQKFANGLKAVPDAELTAVGSRSLERANTFAEAFNIPHRHSDYRDLADNPDVDVIYVATLHPFHKECAILCLEAGKAVLCEKPLTVDVNQAEEMIACAREHNQFLMEAMWTRFLPIMVKVREWLADGAIGEPRMLTADKGSREVLSIETLEGRRFNPELGGGGLLDVGVYTIALAYMVFGAPSKVTGLAHIGQTNVDEQASILLGYDTGQIANLFCAIRTETLKEARIIGTKGSIHIPRFWEATSATLEVVGKEPVRIKIPFKENGFEYQAIEVANCLREGKLESDVLPLDESLSIIRTMDTIREQWGLEYPKFKSVFATSQNKVVNQEEGLKTRAWEVKESPTDLGYQVIPNWPKIPAGMIAGSVSGVAVDSQDRTYVFHRFSARTGGNIRKQPPWLLCFDSKGELLFTRQEPEIGRAHMVAVDEDDAVWVCDDGNHVIYKLSETGEILKTLGEKGVLGDDGSHFDRQTDIAFGPNGEMYVSDGDSAGNNRRIVKLDRDGNFLLEWGKEGIGPGEFAPPHAVTVDDEGTVFVSDRNNWRVQVFDADGKLEVVWSHIGRIYDVVPDGKGDYFTVDGKIGRVTKIDRQGNVIGFFGTTGNKEGQLSTGHSIDMCPNGDIVIGHLDGRIQRFSRRQ